jgi:hypothetical protein
MTGTCPEFWTSNHLIVRYRRAAMNLALGLTSLPGNFVVLDLWEESHRSKLLNIPIRPVCDDGHLWLPDSVAPLRLRLNKSRKIPYFTRSGVIISM